MIRVRVRLCIGLGLRLWTLSGFRTCRVRVEVR